VASLAVVYIGSASRHDLSTTPRQKSPTAAEEIPTRGGGRGGVVYGGTADTAKSGIHHSGLPDRFVQRYSKVLYVVYILVCIMSLCVKTHMCLNY
jgi:hypothetical protein